MAIQATRHVTPEEYLDFERASPTKHEYLAGQIYAMTGASLAHNIITVNLTITLGNQLDGGPCQLFAGDMRVKVEATTLYTYPDVAVVCGELHFDDEAHLDTLTNPTLLIEVLSRSTELYDRSQKFAHYRRLASLQAYLLVAQDAARVERYRRQPNGDWTLTVVEGLDGVLALPSIGAALRLADVYKRVTLPEDPAQP